MPTAAEDACMIQAYEDHILSQSCETAINNVIIVHDQLVKEEMMEEYAAAFAAFLAFTFFILFVFSILACCLGKNQRRMARVREMRRKVVRAVYEDSEIKALVESKLGESIGMVPPVRLEAVPEPEPCGCKCFLKTVLRFICVFIAVTFVLNVFVAFPPIALFCFLVFGIVTVKRMCVAATGRSRPRSDDDDGMPMISNPGYPAAFERKDPATVYVGVPVPVIM